ncbi:hypothetical protein WIS52_14935 [Pseudonocardia nematodicida]|uniref:Uncharacterized protein n=1 Tax=Pseudonocardia nematodicida TaxID=1206997 RepID=A0ABV1KDR4_9PSEU
MILTWGASVSDREPPSLTDSDRTGNVLGTRPVGLAARRVTDVACGGPPEEFVRFGERVTITGQFDARDALASIERSLNELKQSSALDSIRRDLRQQESELIEQRRNGAKVTALRETEKRVGKLRRRLRAVASATTSPDHSDFLRGVQHEFAEMADRRQNPLAGDVTEAPVIATYDTAARLGMIVVAAAQSKQEIDSSHIFEPQLDADRKTFYGLHYCEDLPASFRSVGQTTLQEVTGDTKVRNIEWSKDGVIYSKIVTSLFSPTMSPLEVLSEIRTAFTNRDPEQDHFRKGPPPLIHWTGTSRSGRTILGFCTPDRSYIVSGYPDIPKRSIDSE